MKARTILLTLLMVSAGVYHLARPKFFISIVPGYLPNAPFLVALSGFLEILGGLGLVWKLTRRYASWGLIALLICVFPANVNMALHPSGFATWLLWLRLPLQWVLIAWAWSARR